MKKNMITNCFWLLTIFLNTNIFSQPDLSTPIVTDDVIFEEKNGLVAVEAEFFHKQTMTEVRKWHITAKDMYPDVGRDVDNPHLVNASNNAYIEILPDTRVTHDDKLITGENFSNQPGKMGVLFYKVHFNTPGRYYVWVRNNHTGGEDNGIHVGINGTWPESGQRMQWCPGRNTWRWESKQRTKEVHCGEPYRIFLDIEKSGIQDIMFSMREDGFEFDKFILTLEKRSERFKGTGPEVRLKSGELPPPFPEVKKNPVTTGTNKKPEISGELRKWHKVTLTFDGPSTSETDENNPFMNYRLNVHFTHRESGKKQVIPGYFAADGNAAETSAHSGSKWRVHFAPGETGMWDYKVDFRKGNWVAVSESEKPGKSANYMDNAYGSFNIKPTDKTGRDNRARGRLNYVGKRYLQFAETGEYFLKCGADAPENFLSYEDFDGTFHDDGHGDKYVKSWEPHVKHWKEGNPGWQNGKGKGIIGAVNYLHSEGMNVFSFLTMNIEGDDKNVFPYIDYETYDRFDVSKLDQWEIVFDHADKLGMFLHFKIMEQENQGLLDNGGLGATRKLLYRELIARFGHHLALNWNMCEENGEWVDNHRTPPQFTNQRLAMADYFYHHDPYHHHVVIHNGIPFYDILGKESRYTGISLQTHKTDFSLVHPHALKWINESAHAGRQWAVSVDEPGDAKHALLPDAENPEHDNARKNGLWGAFMAGSWGTEWYFGYKHEHSDLTCQDYASRELFWKQGKIALDFFHEHVPFWDMENHNPLIGNHDNKPGAYCFAKEGEIYLVYLSGDSYPLLDLSNSGGRFEVKWFNPANGGKLQTGSVKKLKGGKKADYGKPPTNPDKDWVVLIRKL